MNKTVTFIRWKDAYDQSGGWRSLKDVEDWVDAEYIVTNIGFIVHEDDEYITLTGMIAEITDVEDPMVGSVIKIPKKVVFERKEIIIR